MGNIIFDGYNFEDYGVVVSGSGTWNMPERRTVKDVIPGKHGALITDSGEFENVEIPYPAWIARGFAERYEEFSRMLALHTDKYYRLEDSYHPDVFYLAMPTGGISVKTSGYMNREGQFDLEFTRKPQRFLKTGEEVISLTQGGTIYNPTLFDALPLIRIYGTGTVTIGSVEVAWNGPSSYVDLDCDIQDAYYMGSNMNQYIQLSGYDFPKLEPGETQIILGTGITRVDITPRWWIL